MDNLENRIKALDTKIVRLEEDLERLEKEILFDNLSIRTCRLLAHGDMKKEVEQ